MRLRTLSLTRFPKLLIAAGIGLALMMPLFAQAQDYTDQLGDAATEVYGSEDADEGDFTLIVANLINVVLSILGIILLVIIVYAGALWMTAGGNSDQVGKAKSWLINAVIGLIITLAAYAISNFVIGALAQGGLV